MMLLRQFDYHKVVNRMFRHINRGLQDPSNRRMVYRAVCNSFEKPNEAHLDITLHPEDALFSSLPVLVSTPGFVPV